MTKQELIDEVMDNFDFTKVAKTMKALGWVWATTQFDVPEESEIRKQVRELLNLVCDAAIRTGSDCKMGTGGFKAAFKIDHKVLCLKFVLSSWETDGEF